MSNASAKLLAAAVLTAMLALAASHAVELDPKAVVINCRIKSSGVR
jgi:hypothetical protein